MGLHVDHNTTTNRELTATKRGNCIMRGATCRRYTASQLLLPQNHHHRHGERREHEAPNHSAHEQCQSTAIARQLAQELRQPGPSGTKLSTHTRSHRISGTKLSTHTRNGPIRHVLPTQGEFCTALVSRTLSRENFVPNTRQKSNQPTQQHSKRDRCKGRRRNHRNTAATPAGGGGAWPDNEPTRRAKLAARAAHGRATAHGHTQRPGPTAPGTPAHPRQPRCPHRRKRPPGTGWAYLSRLWESNPRPIHYE